MDWGSFFNLKSLKRDINENLVLFVGAGASISAPTSLPSFITLRNEIIRLIFNDITEFNKYLNELLNTPTKPELILQTIWDYFGYTINPIKGFEKSSPNINHHYISLLCRSGVKIIITTNFDNCIEKSLDYHGIKYIVKPGTPNNELEYNDIFNCITTNIDKVIIWKPHGDVLNPKSLCYTIEQVAKLNNSIYLKRLYNLLISNYNFLLVGYSGYDDDFFPILYNYPINNRIAHKIYWNAYDKIQTNTPPYHLKKRWKHSIKFIYGDMTNIFSRLFNINVPIFNIEQGANWKLLLKNEINKLDIDDKISIIGKYCFLLSKINIAYDIWRYGLSLKHVKLENKLRFAANTITNNQSLSKLLSESIKLNYYQISNVIIINLIVSSIKSSPNINQAYKYIRYYRQLNKQSPAYFPYHIYLSLFGEYLVTKYKNSKRISRIYSQLQKKIMEMLYENGDILNFVSQYSKYIAHLAQNYYSSIEEYDKIIQFLPLIEAYNIPYNLSELYYSLAIFATHISKNKDAMKFLELSESNLKLAYNWGTYKEAQYKVLLSIIKHEMASHGTASNAISVCWECINIISSINDNEHLDRTKDEYYGIYYTSLANNYLIINNLDKAEECAKKAVNFHYRCNSIRGEGRAYFALAKILKKRKKHKESYNYFHKALIKLEIVGENVERIKKEMNE